jgi:hypothetical protein
MAEANVGAAGLAVLRHLEADLGEARRRLP